MSQANAPAQPAEPPLTAEEQAALEEPVDLDVETRRRVLSMHRSLDRMDHYALLGISRTVDRKQIKRAYYALAAVVHPDKYFRKNLGSFKQRMEIIFGRLTLAHDALTSTEKRAEYDAYLDEQRRSRGIEELLAEAIAEVRQAQESIEQQVRAQEAQAPSASQMPSMPSPPAASQPPMPPSSPAMSAAARRDALARRLLGGRAPSMTPGALPATRPPAAPATTGEAIEALRRRYEERVAQAKSAQTRRYLASAEAAVVAGDPLAATNAFRVAQALAPDDADIARRAADAQARADGILGDTYARQARYEEKNGQWTDAARTWARVCGVRPADAGAHERAAHALVKANRDLPEAARLASRAVTLEPRNPAFRVTLAAVHLAAGMSPSARRELEAAAQLAPHDGTIQAMLERAGRSG